MSKKLREIQSRKAKLVADARTITDKAAAENRDMTPEESTSFDDLMAKVATANKDIEREQTLIAEEARLNVRDLPGTQISGGHERAEDDPKRGFATFGHFAQAVRQNPGFQGSGLAMNGQLIVAAAPTTYGSEGVGADGGFLIPPEYSTDIFTLSLQEDSLLPVTDNQEIGGNSMTYPKDETTPWGTDGVRAYWQSEAGAATQTKPKLGTATLRLNKLMALVPLTDELLADAPALGSYVQPLMARSIRWKTNEAILNGLGNGQPQGAFKGAAAVVQNKDSGQAASTLSALNCSNMYARLPPGSLDRAFWLITPDALPSLFTMTLGNYPIFIPTANPTQGGLSMRPAGMLLGLPVYPSQHVAAFSSTGDLSLLDLSYYRTITKAGGMQTATSMHLYFDADAMAFRVTFRVDGAPKIAAAISQAKGSNTLSPFVQLQNR